MFTEATLRKELKLVDEQLREAVLILQDRELASREFSKHDGRIDTACLPNTQAGSLIE